MALGLQQVEAIDLSQRTKWYALVRLVFLLAIAVPGLLSLYVFQGWNSIAANAALISLVAVISNFVFYGLLRIRHNSTYHAYLAIIWIVFDILLITLFIFTNGGIESRSPILYVVPVLISAALFGRQGIYMSSLTSTVLYVGMIVADFFGYIHSTGAIDPTLRTNLPYVVNTITFFPSIFLVIALAVDFITGLLSQKQEQLSQSIEALESAQETARLGSWEWDIKNNDLVWSKELFDIYGIEQTSGKASADGYFHLVHPDDLRAHKQAFRTSLRKKIAFKNDYRILRPDGTVRYLHGEGKPVLGKDGNVTKLIGICQDVTELHYLDIAKQEFVSLASHQLRTPASGVKAFLSLLLEGYVGKMSRKQTTFLKKAYDSNNRQLEIIDSLLSLASIEAGKMSMYRETVDLVKLTQRCITSHKHAIREKKHKLMFEHPRGSINVTADVNALQMAIDNLISNANKYTPEGGEITVSLSTKHSSCYLEVKDTGIGIAKHDIPSLFKKFSRLSDPASKTVGGSGLGLYMAKYIVELHKGKLSVKSQHGTGTTFTIKLPLTSKKK